MTNKEPTHIHIKGMGNVTARDLMALRRFLIGIAQDANANWEWYEAIQLGQAAEALKVLGSLVFGEEAIKRELL